MFSKSHLANHYSDINRQGKGKHNSHKTILQTVLAFYKNIVVELQVFV